MRKEILALLEKKFQGERKDGLNHLAGVIALQVTTEEEITAIVDKLTADGVKAFIVDWRKEADAEIHESNRTREVNLRKKYDFVDKKTVDPPKEPEETPATGALDAAAIQKIVSEAVGTATRSLLDEVNALKGETVYAGRRKLLEKELDNVPDGYKGKVLKDFDRMTFKDEDGFQDYLNDTKKDVVQFGQELAEKGLAGNHRPLFGSVNPEGVSAGVQSYIKEQSGGKTLSGKEV
jgi:hypothetical protein